MQKVHGDGSCREFTLSIIENMMTMQKDEVTELLTIAKGAALAAGTYLLNSGQSFKNISSNVGRDIKIEADTTSESIILNYLKERSCFSILSEESGLIERNSNSLTWIVDPLDGSLNYSRGIPVCCVSVALWEKNKPVIGVVYDFYRDELYAGIPGIGAWLNENKIEASTVGKMENAVLCTGFPVNTDFSEERLKIFVQKIQNYKKIRLLGSAALSIVYVASGRADAYLENDIMLWDVAGGLAVANGAGCNISLNDGIKPNSFHVVVSNGMFNAA